MGRDSGKKIKQSTRIIYTYIYAHIRKTVNKKGIKKKKKTSLSRYLLQPTSSSHLSYRNRGRIHGRFSRPPNVRRRRLSITVFFLPYHCSASIGGGGWSSANLAWRRGAERSKSTTSSRRVICYNIIRRYVCYVHHIPASPRHIWHGGSRHGHTIGDRFSVPVTYITTIAANVTVDRSAMMMSGSCTARAHLRRARIYILYKSITLSGGWGGNERGTTRTQIRRAAGRLLSKYFHNASSISIEKKKKNAINTRIAYVCATRRDVSTPLYIIYGSRGRHMWLSCRPAETRLPWGKLRRVMYCVPRARTHSKWEKRFLCARAGPFGVYVLYVLYTYGW